MWQRPANTIPTHPQRPSATWFCLGSIFFIPQLVGIACGIIRGVVWCIWQKLRWDRVCVYVAVWNTLSWIETALQLVWRDSTPNWILDGFKFQSSTVSVWWAMGEGGSSTIKLAFAVKTLVLSHHKLPLANACSKIGQVCPDNMVNLNFYLQIYITPLIQVMVSGKSTWLSTWFLHALLYLKKVSTYPTYLTDGF